MKVSFVTVWNSTSKDGGVPPGATFREADRTAQEKTPVLQGSASECDVVRVAGVPRKDSNNLKKHRDVWPNPKQALQKALQLVTICRRSTPNWPR